MKQTITAKLKLHMTKEQFQALRATQLAYRDALNYVSQYAYACGHTSKENRPRKGLLFVCQACHSTLHADLVGARNIALRTLLIRQDWMSTGTLSVYPDVSGREAKAARLKRYAELRWSPETSSSRSTGLSD